MAMCLPSMKRHPGHMYPKTAFQVHEELKRYKIRLELRKRLQGCTLFFYVSMSCKD